VQKPRFADPFFLFHQLRVHDGDVAGSPAETDEAELEPKPKSFGESWMRNIFFVRHCSFMPAAEGLCIEKILGS
jgi:hypothetical protein